MRGCGGAGSARCEPALQPPGRIPRPPRRRQKHRRHDADGVGQDALLQPAGPRRDAARPATRALYLFPTKALAQDQMAELHELIEHDGELGAATSASSPTTATRRRTRAGPSARAPNRVQQPRHAPLGHPAAPPKWAKLFENLRYIVIDELHAYRGVFGTHCQRAAPPAPRVRALRIEAAVHLLVGDDRQSAGARRAAGRAAVVAGRPRAARRAARSSSSSSIRRS